MVDEFRTLLIGLNREAKDLQAEYLRLKEAASESKKSWEAKVLEIQAAIDEDYPLFDRKDDPPADGGGGWGGGGDDGPKGPSSPPPSGGGDVIDVSFEVMAPQLPSPEIRVPSVPAISAESWRADSLEVLTYSPHGLSDKLVERMAEAGLKTMGDLSNWSNSGKLLTDIEGVGESRAEEIESALESYWAERQRQQAAPKKGGDLVTSRPGTWRDGEPEATEAKPKRSRKKTA